MPKCLKRDKKVQTKIELDQISCDDSIVSEQAVSKVLEEIIGKPVAGLSYDLKKKLYSTVSKSKFHKALPNY